MVLISDQVTKWIARADLDPTQPVEIIPGYLRLSYLHNTGVAFGFFDNLESDWKPYVLGGMAIVALVAIAVYSVRAPRNRVLLQTALAITMGGILGNFIDRVLRGYVIDFIEFHVHEVFYWPTFNVADSAITIGIVLLLIDTLRNPAAAGEQSAVGSGQ